MSKPEKHPYVRPDDLGVEDFDLGVSVIIDGTRTVVEVVDDDGDQVGVGTAVRRKGDKRNPEVGIKLALSRALSDAAGRYRQDVEDIFVGRVRPEGTTAP